MSPREAGLWAVQDYLEGYEQFRNVPRSEFIIRTTNHEEIRRAQFEARKSWEREHGAWPAGDIRLPIDMPRPKVMLPAVDYAPDFVNTSGLYMVSARLRYAMALPDSTCQYLPIALIDGSDMAYEQDYKWLAYLAREDVIDPDRSEYDLAKLYPGQSEADRHFGDIRRFVVKDDFEPRGGLFEMARRPAVMLGTETLARRVDRAGCTGMSFVEVETRVQSFLPPRYRASSRR